MPNIWISLYILVKFTVLLILLLQLASALSTGLRCINQAQFTSQRGLSTLCYQRILYFPVQSIFYLWVSPVVMNMRPILKTVFMFRWMVTSISMITSSLSTQPCLNCPNWWEPFVRSLELLQRLCKNPQMWLSLQTQPVPSIWLFLVFGLFCLFYCRNKLLLAIRVDIFSN